VQTTTKEKKICACLNMKKLMTKNAIDKSTILHNSNIFNPIVNPHSCFVFGTHFNYIITKLIPFFETTRKGKNIQIYLKGETLIAIWNLGVNNITTTLELNWIPIQQIESKFNWKAMRCKLVANVLKIYLWIRCWKKKNFRKTILIPLYLGMG